MTDREAALEAACEYYGVPVNGDSAKGQAVTDLIRLILAQRREAKIEALEWAKANVQPYGGTGIVTVIEAEIARLKGEA